MYCVAYSLFEDFKTVCSCIGVVGMWPVFIALRGSAGLTVLLET